MSEQNLTGYPSIDKPWMKYYSEEAIHAPLPERTVYEYLRESSKGRLDKIALNYFGKRISYSALLKSIDVLTSALFSFGVRASDPVLFFALNTPECIYCFYALSRIGAEIDFESLNLSAVELEKTIALRKPKLILSVDSFLPVVIKAAVSIPVISLPVMRSLPWYKHPFLHNASRTRHALSYDCLLKRYTQNEKPAIPPQGSRIILHTGGTTGIPKRVVLCDQNLNAVAEQYKRSLLELLPGEKLLNIAPPFVAFGLCLAIHTPLCLGMQCCLSPNPDPEQNDKSYFYYRPEHFLGGPAHIRRIVSSKRAQNADLSFAKTVGYGGESIPPEVCETFTAFFRSHGSKITHLSPGYGMTECAGTVVTAGRTVYRPGTVGIPLVLSNVKIVAPDSDRELRIGEIGEVWLSSPSLMLGYWNDPKENQKVLTTDGVGTRWIKTGDLGRIDEDGFLHITGRIKRIKLVKASDGSVYKLYPAYIEACLRELPALQDCAVVTLPHNEADNKPIAFVAAAGTEACEAAILAHCRSKLPAYSVPEKIIFLPALPVTVGGKTDYHTLERMAAEQENAAE